MDLMIMIGLSFSISKKFKERGKIGAGKYIAGIIASVLVGEFVGLAIYINTDNFLLFLLPIVLFYGGAFGIYNLGKKEAETGAPNSTVYNEYYQPLVGDEPVCKAYVKGKCSAYGVDSGYLCDYNPNDWRNCQVVQSNIQSYGKW